MTRPAALLALFTVLSALDARAEEVVYGPDGAPTVVQRKLYRMSNKWEVGLAFGTALNTSLVDHHGGLASISYHPNEWLDAGLDVLANYTPLSGLSGQIRDNLPARANGATQTPNAGDEIRNADQMRGGAFATARIAPIYGKINLASELSVHFQAFLLAGAGAGAFKHESVNLCATAGSAPCDPNRFAAATSFKPVGEAGGGMRFYLGPRVSLRAEVRAFFYPATYVRNADLTQPGTGTTRRYLGLVTLLGLGASALF